MNTLFEQQVAQNTALTACAIAQAAMRFDEEVGSKRGLDLFAALLIPALVYHRKTATSFATRQMSEGLFFRVVVDDPELVVGVQTRLMTMATHTFQAIHLGCSAGLVRLARDRSIQLFPGPKSLPSEVDNSQTVESVHVLFAAAKRLGYCFATTEFAVICAVLRARF